MDNAKDEISLEVLIQLDQTDRIANLLEECRNCLTMLKPAPTEKKLEYKSPFGLKFIPSAMPIAVDIDNYDVGSLPSAQFGDFIDKTLKSEDPALYFDKDPVTIPRPSNAVQNILRRVIDARHDRLDTQQNSFVELGEYTLELQGAIVDLKSSYNDLFRGYTVEVTSPKKSGSSSNRDINARNISASSQLQEILKLKNERPKTVPSPMIHSSKDALLNAYRSKNQAYNELEHAYDELERILNMVVKSYIQFIKENK